MSDRRFEPDQIYDLPALPPDATHDELLEHQQREDQWRRTREPVATGSKFLKFITWADLVKAGVITVSDVVGNDDPDLPDGDPDGNNPDSPDFVNEPRIAVYARDMFLPITYACSPLTIIENDPAKPNLQVLLFDPDTYESAQFVLILPKEWPGRALRYRVYWSHGSGATAYDVSWDMTVHSYEDGESLLTDWATGLQITDTGGTADTVYITNESAAVTVNGALAKPHDLLLFRITRLAAEASDTLDVDARLHAVEFNIGVVDVDFPPVPSPYALLMHFDGNLTDSSEAGHSFTAAGGAATSGALAKFGSEAMTFDGSDDYIYCADAPEFDFGAGLFSVDFWIYVPTSANLSTERFVLGQWGAAPDQGWGIVLYAGGYFGWYDSPDGSSGGRWQASASTVPRDQWFHAAFWRTTAGGAAASIDGVTLYAIRPTLGTINNSGADFTIGASAGLGGIQAAGVFIDELRICKGSSDYDNTSFTPPTSAYT